MSSALNSQAVSDALRDLRALGVREDVSYRQAVEAREAELGVRLGAAERTPLAVNAPLAITPEVGQVLHAMVLAGRPLVSVEFGASLGISTIYLASALADLGAGRVITTELVASKAQRTQIMLERAGLAEHVEVRAGDALQTLRNIATPIDLLFLDGANDLYLDVLGLLRPHLSATAIIAADMSDGDADHDAYRAHVNDPRNGLLSSEIPIDAGLLISTPARD